VEVVDDMGRVLEVVVRTIAGGGGCCVMYDGDGGRHGGKHVPCVVEVVDASPGIACMARHVGAAVGEQRWVAGQVASSVAGEGSHKCIGCVH